MRRAHSASALSNIVVQAIKDGKTPEQALEAANTSRFGANHAQTLLEEPVKIDVTGEPVTGPSDAPDYHRRVFRFPMPILHSGRA